MFFKCVRTSWIRVDCLTIQYVSILLPVLYMHVQLNSVCLSACMCLLFSISALECVRIYSVISYCRPCCHLEWVCVFVCLCVCVCMDFLFFFFFAVGSLSGLQVLKSMRFNTSSNLTLPDTALKPWKWDWKDTEALFSPQSRGFMSLGWGQLSFHWSVMPRSERQSCHLKCLTCIFFMTLKGQL